MATAFRFLRLSSLKDSAKLLSIRSYSHSAPKYIEALKNLSETTVTELPNGLRVATEFSDTPMANIGLWIQSGSRYEDKTISGAANFFEHLAFKGTKNRSQKDIESEIIKLGAELHASTGREETLLYAKCLAQDVPKAIDILGDAVQNTKIDDAEVEGQKKVILSELEAIQSDLKQVTFDYLHMTAYQGTELEKSVYGSSETIQKMSKDNIASYIERNFTAPRMVLVATGNVKHDDVVQLAQKHLGDIPSAAETSSIAKTCRFTGSDVRDRDDWLPFAHVAVAVDTCGYTSPDVYPLMLAKAHIGSWDKTSFASPYSSNKLVEHVYRGPGCHSFEAFHTLYQDTGLWGCLFVVDCMSLDDFVYNLQDEWMKLCVSMTDSNLAKAKAKLRNQISLPIEDGAQSLSNIGREVHNYNYRIPLAEVAEKIEAVTLMQLKETCAKYIYDRCPAVASVGPVEGMTDYNRLRSGMYWLRY